ncbi:MAG: 1-deoxy-D-xylulose-5-phosphate synthase, partial [Planctomycetes bacterium]|nr:1-deoxy-D-xylulose-5-phosphate synthase [Planctomycetota bacterium]
MPELLPKINSPEDLRRLQIVELPRLADEIRREIIAVVSRNHGHLASNLGAVELALALHYCFDFLKDRLVWDVGHQCYTHKLLTGRRERFHTLRQHDGLSGFPDRTESPYDPFTTGHAGTAISSALGLACGDALTGQSRKVVAVVGDGAMGAGMSFEGLNQAGHLRKNILVVLNDNRMAISCTVGALSNYLTAVRSAPLYSDFKKEIHHLLNMVPVFGRRMEEALEHLKAAVKKSM